MARNLKVLTISGLVLAAFVAACRLFRPVADFYALRLYPAISAALSLIASPFPFSLQELAVALAVVLFVVIVVRSVRKRRKWYGALGRIALLGLWIFVWSYVGWGCNYFRSPLTARAGKVPVRYEEARFKEFLSEYSAALNSSYTSGTCSDRDALESGTKEVYSSVPKQYGLSEPRRWQHPKKLIFNRLQSACGVMGFIGPMFDESQIVAGIPEVERPFTYAHEYSHVLGVSNESEANWWAFQVCRRSEDPAVRYSAYFSLLGHVLSNARRALGQDEYKSFVAGIRPEVLNDYEQVRQYWKGQRIPALDRFQTWIYDLFLKSNSIPSGVANYSEVIRLLLSLEDFRPSDGVQLQRCSPEEAGMDQDKLSLVRGEARKAIADGKIPGCVVGVVKGDKLAFLEAYGNRQVYPDKIAMTVGTIFDLASVSKCVSTTLSVLQLVESGRCKLDDKVSDYIDGFQPWTDPSTGETDDITIQDLMTHSSGLSAYVEMDEYLKRFDADTPDSLMHVIATETERHFKPGTGYIYSCLNFVTLQNILQNITGKRLCDYAQENVFDALGLRHTCYRLAETRPELLPLAAPTEVQADGSVLCGQVHDPLARIANSGNSGNAGVFSDCEDLAVICAAILNGGEIQGRRILKPETVELMETVPADNNPSIGRALGWDTRDGYICHTGYTGTYIIMDPEAKVAVIVLANRVHPRDEGGIGELRRKIADLILSSD